MLTRRYRDDRHRSPVVAHWRLHASRRLVLMLTTPDDCYMSTSHYRLPTRTAAPLRATGDALLGSKPSNRTNRTVCKRGCIKLHSHDTQKGQRSRSQGHVTKTRQCMVISTSNFAEHFSTHHIFGTLQDKMKRISATTWQVFGPPCRSTTMQSLIQFIRVGLLSSQVNVKVNVNFDDFFALSTNTNTMGHKYKLFKPRCTASIRQKFFVDKVINVWNLLPCTTNFASLNVLGIPLKRLISPVFLVCNIFICVIEYVPSKR